jgi:hypothetical protein
VPFVEDQHSVFPEDDPPEPEGHDPLIPVSLSRTAGKAPWGFAKI